MIKDKKRFKAWLKAAGMRAFKTVIQAAISTLSTSAFLSEVDWRLVLSASLLAGIISLLMSLKGLPELKINDGDVDPTDPEIIPDPDSDDIQYEDSSEDTTDDSTEGNEN